MLNWNRKRGVLLDTQNYESVDDEAQKLIRKYVLSSLQYLENGQLMLLKGEAGKAGEFLWGSIAQSLHALAASKNMPQLRSHRSLRYFVSTVSREINDRRLNEVFWQAEKLHSNFHEVDLTTEEIAEFVEPIREAVQKLHSLIPAELVSEKVDED